MNKDINNNELYIKSELDKISNQEREDLDTNRREMILAWVNELDKKRLTKKKFHNQILPHFRIFYERGIRGLGIGTDYNILAIAEKYGLEVTSDVVECIRLVMKTHDLEMPNDIENMSSTRKLFAVVGMIRNLRRFQLQGYPVDKDLARIYDILVEREEQEARTQREEPLNPNTSKDMSDTPLEESNNEPQSLVRKRVDQPIE